jgi:hypothetical protein
MDAAGSARDHVRAPIPSAPARRTDMHAADLELPVISSLPLLIDPSAALSAAQRLARHCPSRQRHSALLGRLVSASEAERLDRQREDELRRHAASGGVTHVAVHDPCELDDDDESGSDDAADTAAAMRSTPARGPAIEVCHTH